MIEATKINCFETVLGAVVDHDEMVIKNVSIITEGIAKGHGVQIDKTTLEQVMDLAKEFEGGLKVKMDHFSGFSGIVGRINNFKIKGKKLLGDLHLLKNAQASPFVLEMAEEMPDTFGLSISFSGDDEEKSGHMFARATELYSADLVDEPAANPTGLFSSKPQEIDTHLPVETSNNMSNQNNTSDAPTVDLAKQIADLNALVTNLASKIPQEEKELTDETPLSEINFGQLRGVLQKDTAKLMSEAGWKPSDLSADPKKEDLADTKVEDTEPKTFQEVIASLVTGGMSKSEAVTHAYSNPNNEQLITNFKNSGGIAHL